MNDTRTPRRRRNAALVGIALAAALIGISACSSSSSSPGGQAGSSTGAKGGGSLSIWVDATRVPAVQAFEKANPTIKVTINTFANTGNDNGLKQKFSLFNQAGSGWPDLIFLGGNDLAWADSTQINYAADLTSQISSTIKSGFAPSVIAPCQHDGKLVCLPNDLGQDVLWYNSTLFKQWGYQPPSTWQQYQALSLTIAKDHPGYYTGLVGDANTPSRYLWPSGCPTSTLTAATTVRIALDASSCTRVRDMLSTLVQSKVVSSAGLFDSNTATQVGPKLVMTPGASWYGDFIFKATFKTPAGQITASPALQWAGEQSGTGAEGGGLWVVSRHATGQRLADAAKAATFLSTDQTLLTGSPTFPAYGPVQAPWLAAQKQSGYFADYDQLQAAFTSAAKQIRTDTNYVQYNTGNVWTQTVTSGLSQGKSFASGWSQFSTQLAQQAKLSGYTVATS